MSLWFESFYTDFAAAIVFLACLGFVYIKYKYNYWPRNNIPQLEPSFPFGNYDNIITKNETFGITFEKIYNAFRDKEIPFAGYYLALKPQLMLMDPDIIKDILVKDFQYFPGRGIFSDEKNDPLTAHLFTLKGAEWKNLRGKLSPTFTSGKIKMMFETLVACGDELNNILEEKQRLGETMNIKDYLSRFTCDIIGSCGFGIDCNCLKNPNSDFRKYGQLFFEPQGLNVLRQVGGILLPDLIKKLKIKSLNSDISDFFMRVVKNTVEYREKNNVSRKDFMQLLIQLKSPNKLDKTNLTDDDLTDGENSQAHAQAKSKLHNDTKSNQGLTMEQIAAQCFVFFLAGFETSSTTMTFCIYELVRNPELQEKVRQEINSVLAKHGGNLTYEAIMDMHYMEKVINETMRKYPPLPFLQRQCANDYPLPKSTYIIRQNQMVTISVLGLQRDPQYYPNPMKFDPERFNEEECAKRHPFTFLPFGEGPRICIGLRFGMILTKVGLTTLLKNNKFTLNSKTKEPVVMNPNSFILSTVGGIWVDAHKVKS